jgi:hypothetical protein
MVRHLWAQRARTCVTVCYSFVSQGRPRVAEAECAQHSFSPVPPIRPCGQGRTGSEGLPQAIPGMHSQDGVTQPGQVVPWIRTTLLLKEPVCLRKST